MGFSFCCPSVADKTLDVDSGKRVIKRRRMKRIKGGGGRARVVGLGDEVHRAFPFDRDFVRKKIAIGLNRSTRVSGLRIIQI